MDVVCLGELFIDMFPSELGKELTEVSAFRPKPGGAPANVAVAAKRLGMQSAFIGKVGDDAFGHHLADVLRQEGVDVRGMRYDKEARTGMAFIAMPDENSYDILFYRNPGADMRLRPDELDRELLRETRAFHFGSISLIQEPSRSATLDAVKIAREAGGLISFDVNYRPDLWSRDEARKRVLTMLPYVDVLKINEEELFLLSGSDDLKAGSKSLLDLGPAVCVVTVGPRGSFFQIAHGAEHVPAFRIETVDATGCGDAFVAGMLCQFLAGSFSRDWRDQLTVVRLREVLRYANAVGALTALTQGVIPALPNADEVEEFLSQQSWSKSGVLSLVLSGHRRIEGQSKGGDIMTQTTVPQALREKARDLRLDVLDMTTKAASGHVSSSYSCVEILTALYFGGILRYRSHEPDWPERDRFIMSKGHAAPLLYATLAHAGYFDREKLWTLRQINSPVEGHPIQSSLPGVETTTGSLGKGISVGLGHVIGGRLNGLDYRVYVLLGDGECQEGQIWESAIAASHFKADNMAAIVDYNKYQETGPISREMALEPFVEKWRAFGWHVEEVDGHDIQALIEVLRAVQRVKGKPSVIIAHTVKGKGVSFVEADYTFHGKALTPEQAEKARKEILCS